MSQASTNITGLLRDVERGKRGASDALMRAVYGELRTIADRQMRAVAHPSTLQPTALVHEAYLQLFGKQELAWENRRHFYFAAARAMHDILVDRARKRSARKRGGDRRRVDTEADQLLDAQADEVLATSHALEELGVVDGEAAEVVMLRFFGGLTHAEAAEALGVSEATVRRRWTFARAWLLENLSE